MRQYNSSLIFNIQQYSLHDGPGIRTVVFFKGCPMRCRWCCNPESQNYEAEIFYNADRCIGGSECGFCKGVCDNGAISINDKAEIDRASCIGCRKCADICPSRAIQITGKEFAFCDVLDKVESNAVFYNHGNGGLTVSGGEPLTHADAVIPLLEEAKKRCINTAMETCGYGEYDVLFNAAKYLNTIFFDIKNLDDEKHIEFTGKSNKRIINNFKQLAADFPEKEIIVRTPIIPGFNDNTESIVKIIDFIKPYENISYEVLKYHSFGKSKYTALGRDYPMGDARLDDELFEKLKNMANRGKSA